MNDSNTRQQMAVAAGIMELELRQHKITASVKPLEDGDSSKTWNFACVVAMGTKSSKVRSLDEEISARLHADGAQVFRRRGVFVVSVAKPRNLWRSTTLADVDYALRLGRVSLAHAGVVPVGLDVMNEVICLDLAEVVHLGIVGISGSGKTTLIHHVLGWIAKHSRPEAVRLVYACLDKPEDLRPFLHVPHMAIEPAHELDHVVRTLYLVEDTMRERQRAGVCRPRLVVCVDEVQDLLSQSDEADELLDAIGRRGRSAGISLILGSQRATMAGLSRAAANLGAVLVGKTRTAADGAYALGHSIKESSGIKPHQLLGAGDFVLHQSGMSSRLQAPLLRRRDYAELQRCDAPDWIPCDALPQRSAPDRQAGGWNRRDVDEAEVIADFQAGASINSVCNTYGIGWRRAKQLQALAMNEGDEVQDYEGEDLGGDDPSDDSDAGYSGDPGEE
jgi:S-DNA-T family DNA segregation ATPase FtsK/SpoIIIE